MSSRDDFSPSTKRYVAARASWLCAFTGCRKPTVGPSEESSHAVSQIKSSSHPWRRPGPRKSPLRCLDDKRRAIAH